MTTRERRELARQWRSAGYVFAMFLVVFVVPVFVR